MKNERNERHRGAWRAGTRWTACLMACLVLLLPCTAYGAGTDGAVKLTARQSGTQLYVTMEAADLTFNALQLVLTYDKEQLTPSHYESNSAVSAIRNMTHYLLEPYDLYDNPDGWMETAGSSLDLGAGTVQYVVSVAPGAAGNAADAEGYVSLRSTKLLEMSFAVKGSGLSGSCLELASQPSVPEGVAISAKVNGEEVELTSGDTVELDLSAVVTESGSGSGGSGSGGSDGSGSAGGSGTGGSDGAGGTGNTGGSGGFGGNTDSSSDQGNGSGQNPEQGGQQAVGALKDIASHWSKRNIETLVAKGIVSGYADGTFRPEDSLTRGEFTVVLSKVLGLSAEQGTSSFSDCRTHWAAGYIEACAKAGIVSGTGAGSFSPEQAVSREEIVTMIAKARGLSAKEEARFSDMESVSEWARGYVAAASEAGLIGGYADGTFRPANPVTRGEMAQIVMKLL